MLGAILLARTLPPKSFAIYGYFQITIAMLATYAAMGLGTTASRFFAEVGHTPKEELPPLGGLMSMSVIVAIASFAVILAVPRSWLDAGLAIAPWKIALGVALVVAGVVPAGAILGLEKYRLASAISLISAACMLVLVIIAAQRESAELGIWSVIVGLAVQTIGQTIVVVVSTGWRTLMLSVRWTRPMLTQIATFAGPMFIVSTLAGSATWLISRMILAEGGEWEFAVYTIGLQWFALGLLLPGMVSRAVLPRLVRTQGGESKRLVKQAATMAIAPSITLLIGGALFAPWLIGWYGDSYSSAANIIPAFLAIAVVTAPTNTLGNAIVARDGQKEWLRLTIVWFAALLAALYFVAPQKNASWAAICQLLASSLMLAQTYFTSKRKGLV